MNYIQWKQKNSLGTLQEYIEACQLNAWALDLQEAYLRYANLCNVDLRYANLQNANLQSANMRYAYMRDTDMRNTDMRRADMRRADLRDTNLWNAKMRDANLQGADLGYADLRYANMQNANLQNANLCDAYLSWANLRDANLWDVTMNWNSRELIGERLRQAAGDEYERISLAGAVSINHEYCWDWFLENTPAKVRTWALREMRGWIKEGDVLPTVFKLALDEEETTR